MSISSEINRIKANVSSAFNAVADSGGTIPSSLNSDYLPEAISSIPKGSARSEVNVKTYGAKGDGSTDDTTAFQNALAENRVVYVPGGTYKLSGELVIGRNCKMELEQNVYLTFTQTSGNCISMRASSNIEGNHASIKVPYAFTGRVINIYAGIDKSIVAVPPYTAWGPMWTAARYITDLHIVKLDSSGVAQSEDGTCSGTAVYLGASTNDAMNFLWAVELTRLRISGAFSYGIHMETVRNGLSGWIHQTRISAFIDGAEIGVYLNESTLSYISAMVIPRRDKNSKPYAKHGIVLRNSSNTDLSGSRVMDWNSTYSKWTEGGEYQHLSLLGDCSGTILNEHYYYDSSNYDIRSLIHTDTPSNLERLTILQEPFTRWFKPVDSEPYFYDGDKNKRLLLQEEFEGYISVRQTPLFTNALPTAIDKTGAIFNGIGYIPYGARWNASNGALLTDEPYYGCTGFIPVTAGTTIYAKGLTYPSSGDNNYPNVVLFDANFSRVMSIDRAQLISNSTSWYSEYTPTEDGFELKLKNPTTLAYVAFTFPRAEIDEKSIISVGTPIEYLTEGALTDGINVNGAYVIMTSPNGSRYRLNVSDSGALSAVRI